MMQEINVEKIDKQAGVVSIQYRFYGCDPRQLDDESAIRRLTLTFVRVAGLHVLKSFFYKFTPQGLTGGRTSVVGEVYLSESHFFIHTWPELGYTFMHVAACHPKNLPVAIEYVLGTLRHKKCIGQVLLGEEYLKENRSIEP